jgi:hypothetical protein
MKWTCRSSASSLAAVVAALALAACADRAPPTTPGVFPQPAGKVVQVLACEGSRVTGAFACSAQQPGAGGARATIIGGQGSYVQISGENIGYDDQAEIWSADITFQNLLNEAMGTPDGTTLDASGIRVFFHSGPTVIDGEGTIEVANADGTATFTAAGQPYFRYDEVLSKDEVSGAKTWQLSMPSTVLTFSFLLYVSAEVQPLLVINEVMANPVNPTDPTSDVNLEWLEVYNAGTLAVNMQGMVIADSAASGRRPYHLIASSLPVPPGGYVVLGNTTNTTENGGVPVDYAYGGVLSLANSLDAVKVARVWGTDTLTVDRTQYALAGISAQSGISRELRNPALDNVNMDGSNWADALVTAVYGSGGRGTPKAQNSTFTP